MFHQSSLGQSSLGQSSLGRSSTLGIFLLLFSPSLSWVQAQEEREANTTVGKNVILIVTDDQSPDAGCYGNRVIQTPNLDKLAQAGTLFTHAFCTTASCSASRSVILTGLHNHANGHYGHQHAYHKFNSYANIVSLPTWLRAGGYRTARCGKFHVAPESVYTFDRALRANSRSPVEMANRCQEFLSEKSDQPFFLYFCTSDPHRSGEVASENPLQPNRFGNRPDGTPSYPGVQPVTYNPAQVVVPGFLPDTPTCREELAQYYQSVSRIDQGLGRLMELVHQTGHWNDTLILYISDHGIAMPGAKTTVYDGGLRSPCIVRNPYSPQQGNSSAAMVSWVDITPTILDFAGLLNDDQNRMSEELIQRVQRPQPVEQPARGYQPGTFHGRSFLSRLTQPQTGSWDEIFASHTFHEITMYYPMRVVRTRQYKLIWNIAHALPFPFASDLWAAPTWQTQYQQGAQAAYGKQTVGGYIHRPKFELYDIASDPYEGKNLATDSDFAEVLAQLKEKLRQFQQQTQDPWISKWNYE